MAVLTWFNFDDFDFQLKISFSSIAMFVQKAQNLTYSLWSLIVFHETLVCSMQKVFSCLLGYYQVYLM